MVLVVEKFEDFQKIVSKYVVRSYIVFDKKELNGSIVYRITSGKLGCVVSVDKNNKETIQKIDDWLREIGAVKVEGAVPIEIFFSW